MSPRTFTFSLALGLTAVAALALGEVAHAVGTSAAMSVSPASQSRAAGQEFDVDIAITAPTSVGAYEFTLRFDSAIVDVVSVSDGGFLTSSGRWAHCVTRDLDNILHFGCSTAGPSPAGPTGSGTLARVRLRALKPGVSQLSIRDKSLTNEDGDPLPVSDTDGSVTITGAPVTNTPTPPLPPLPTIPAVPPPSATSVPSSTPLPPTATHTAPAFAPPIPASTPVPAASGAPTATNTAVSAAVAPRATPHATVRTGQSAASHATTAVPGITQAPAADQPGQAAAGGEGEAVSRGIAEEPRAGVLGSTRRPGIKLPDTGTGDAYEGRP